MDVQTNLLQLYTQDDLQQYEQLTHFHNSMPHAMLQTGIPSLIQNIITKPVIISNTKDQLLATVNEREYNNSHVCSPYATYIAYPKSMLDQFNKTWAKILAMIMPRLLGNAFKASKIDKVVQLNNNFAATPHKPDLLHERTQDIINLVTTRYPKHLILIRRINHITNPQLMQALIDNQFLLIPDKPTHLFLPENNYIKRSHTKRDIALLRKSNYQVITHEELTANDIIRIHQLYQALYIEKHTRINPQYTLTFFQQCHQKRWLSFVGLRNSEGTIDAFHSYVQKGHLMNCGPIGYDLDQSSKVGLYRMLVAHGLQHAHNNNLIYNYGSGSDVFKLNRGSEKVLEYTAVYYHHLAKYRHLPWDLLNFFSKNLIPKIFGLNSL